MSDFTIKTADADDLSKYKDFFSRAFTFNSLNQEYSLDIPVGVISKITGIEGNKLIFSGDTPVFFIAFNRTSYKVNIKTMHIDYNYLNDEELFNIIYSEILEKKTIFGSTYVFTYLTSDNNINSSVLAKLGFEPERRYLVMNKFIDDEESKTEDSSDKISFKVIKSNEDIDKRVIVQNSSFNNSHRIPLNREDVIAEMITPTYIPDLSLLMYYKDIAVGYGQIIKSGSLSYLVNFGILEGMRGKGFSHVLLNELLRRSLNSNRRSIFLEVFENNWKAVKLYEKHGFKTMYRKTLWHYGLV